MWRWAKNYADRYPIMLAGILIYLYYLLTSVDLFQHPNKDISFLDYLLQYDSIFIMWIAAAALIQLRKSRKLHQQEEKRRKDMEYALNRQEVYESIVSEITSVLQDNVNNPLAIISVTSREFRRKFEKDPEVIRGLDRIEGAIQRIHHTIRDIQAYESRKIMEATRSALIEGAPEIERHPQNKV